MEKLLLGLQEFLNQINWLFIVVFIILAYTINEAVERKNSFISKINRFFRAIIIAIPLAALFIFLFDMYTKTHIANLIMSIIFATFIYQLGIKTILDQIKKYLGYDRQSRRSKKTTRTVKKNRS